MGFVYHPIPKEVYDRAPPHIRRRMYEHERALLVSLGARQRRGGAECLLIVGVIAALTVIALLVH